MAKIDDSVKKKVPELRFPGFTDDWEERKLGELAKSFEYGLNASAKEFDGYHKYIRITDIDDCTHEFIQNKLTSPDVDFTNADNYILQRGDILFARTGASVGKSYYYKENDGLVYFAGFLIRARIKPEVSPKFVFQNTLTSKYNEFITITSQRSGQPGVNAEEYSNFKMMVPSFEEQEKIGTFFKQLDDTIALHQRKLDLLKEQKKGYLQKVFPKAGEKIPELRFKGFTGDWELRKLKDIFDVHTDFVSNGSFQALKENVQLYKTENYAYMIRLQDASNNWDGPWLYTDKQGFDFLDKSTVYKDDILMSDRGTIGKFFLVPQLDKPMTLSSNAVLLRSTKNDNNFIYYMLNTSNISNQIIVRTTPGVQPMISKTEFKKINTCIPNIEEQQKIGSFFKQLDNTITLHQRKLDLLKEQKKGYLQKMFV